MLESHTKPITTDLKNIQPLFIKEDKLGHTRTFAQSLALLFWSGLCVSTEHQKILQLYFSLDLPWYRSAQVTNIQIMLLNLTPCLWYRYLVTKECLHVQFTNRSFCYYPWLICIIPAIHKECIVLVAHVRIKYFLSISISYHYMDIRCYIEYLVQQRCNSSAKHWSNIFLALTHWYAKMWPSATKWWNHPQGLEFEKVNATMKSNYRDQQTIMGGNKLPVFLL